MTLDEQIAILQAAKEGKTIEWRVRLKGSCWQDYSSGTPRFDFTNYDYRIKHEPHELWAAINHDGVIDYWADDKQTLVDLTDKYPRSWKIVKFREVIE